MTLSYSFTTLVALKAVAEGISRLTVAESRPGCEGRRTACTAASFGIRTELVTDTVACGAMRDADVALFGAEAICHDGTVVNKTGTLALCAAAKAFGKKTLAVATTSKILPEGHLPAIEEMPARELGAGIEGVAVRNPYFEQTPGRLIDRIVTESGELSLQGLWQMALRLSQLLRELMPALS